MYQNKHRNTLMQEADLYEYWFGLARASDTIVTAGHRLKIIESGTLNLHRGPDIRSARFILDNQVYQGSVEFHPDSADWYRHHHHLDKAYEDVLRHLVHKISGTGYSVRHESSGRDILTLPLPARHFSEPGRLCDCILASGISSGKIQNILKQFALQRLELKIRQSLQRLSMMRDDQVFYESTLRMLGYPLNTIPFMALAEKLPWVIVHQWLMKWGHDFNALYTIFAGTAGFLSPQTSDDRYIIQLKERLKILSLQCGSAPLNPESWTMARCRPVNHPHFRLAGFVHLLTSSGRPFWLKALEILSGRRSYEQILPQIEALFEDAMPLYWSKHYILGRSAGSRLPKKFFGKARIREWIINVLIPVAAGRAALENSIGYLEYLKDFFLFIPQPTPYGRFKKIEHNAALPSKAYISQGLLFIKENYCRYQSCAVCPFNVTAVNH
ncbi:MAG: DUF2851 family protein [Calditrichaeota bacterium]|nr:MAG: DUF2851 family protein [Calditrichota bacterium]